MSLNTAHHRNGIVIYKDEWILLYGENVKIEFSGNNMKIFGQRKTGNLFLTTHRLIFLNQNNEDVLKSFSMPLILIGDLTISSELIDSKIITGNVCAEPDEIWGDTVNFKIYFASSSDDTYEFGKALLEAHELITNNTIPEVLKTEIDCFKRIPRESSVNMHTLPSYMFDWLPEKFTDPPPTNQVFIISKQLVYPGLNCVSPGLKAPPPTPSTLSQSMFNFSTSNLGHLESKKSCTSSESTLDLVVEESESLMNQKSSKI